MSECVKELLTKWDAEMEKDFADDPGATIILADRIISKFRNYCESLAFKVRQGVVDDLQIMTVRCEQLSEKLGFVRKQNIDLRTKLEAAKELMEAVGVIFADSDCKPSECINCTSEHCSIRGIGQALAKIEGV